MKRIIILLLTAFCGSVVLVFAADYMVFRFRAFRNISPYAEVTVQEYYEIQEKNNRTEYVYKDTEQEKCINALFSNRGYAPCWYARRHTERAVHI
jgi:hypothetical protein